MEELGGDLSQSLSQSLLLEGGQGGAQLHRSLSKDDDQRPRREGTMWTATAHILTAVIGSGVLSLPWSVAQLGWVAGPLTCLAFAFVTYWGSVLLADCYRSPDGRRNYTYMKAVKANLARNQVWVCGLAQFSQLFGVTVSYVITASNSMGLVKASACHHQRGGTCKYSLKVYMAIFAGFQLIFAHLPDIASLWWLSIVATITSFFYCFTGLGLALAKSLNNRHIHGTIAGVGASGSTKAFQAFQALGNIAFAYSFSIVLIEIQDTIKSSPPENATMKKATLLGTIITTMFYMSVACVGYMAFGNSAPGNLLTGFTEPYWLVIMANICLVIHLTGSYQLCCQPIFLAVEGWASRKWARKDTKQVLGYKKGIRVDWYRLLLRSTYVLVTFFIAVLLPFFNDVLGLIGAFGFWPLTVYLPFEMYIKQVQLKPWTSKWIGLQLMSLISLAVSLAAAVGSVQGIVKDLGRYSPFGS